MPIDPSIPLRVERPKFLTPADMLSLRDLQFRSQAARERHPLEMERLKQETESGRMRSLAEIGKLESDREAKQQAEAIQLATPLVAARPDERPAIYNFIRQESIRRGHSDADQLPTQWSDELYPRL